MEDGNVKDDGSRGSDEAREWKEWKEWKAWREWKRRMEKDEGERERTGTPEVPEPAGVRTQYILSGQPTGWAAMAKVVRDFDEEKVKDCKEDMDTLLVFAGLFSAVLTAFLVESYQSLLEDTSGETLQVLRQIAVQIAQGAGANTTSTSQSPSGPTSVDIRVNVLWFASLLFSLIAASFSILVKQWLREYLAVENPSPQARLRIRHLRYPQLATWKVFEIAALLPLLLQLSLGLFFVGLCYFTASVHSSVGYTTLPLVIGWGFCLVVATLLPLVFPRNPYRTTFLKGLFSSIHRHLRGLASHLAGSSYRRSAHTNVSHLSALWGHIYDGLETLAGKLENVDEKKIVSHQGQDMDILASADAIQSNDELLATSVAEAVTQARPDPEQMMLFVRKLLYNRLQVPVNLDPSRPFDFPILDLRALPLQGRAAILDILSQYLQILPNIEDVFWNKKDLSSAVIIFSTIIAVTDGHIRDDHRRLIHHHFQSVGDSVCCDLAAAFTSNLKNIPSPRDEDRLSTLFQGLAILAENIQITPDAVDFVQRVLSASYNTPLVGIDTAPFPDHISRIVWAWPWDRMTASVRSDLMRFLASNLRRTLGRLARPPEDTVPQTHPLPQAKATLVATICATSIFNSYANERARNALHLTWKGLIHILLEHELSLQVFMDVYSDLPSRWTAAIMLPLIDSNASMVYHHENWRPQIITLRDTILRRLVDPNQPEIDALRCCWLCVFVACLTQASRLSEDLWADLCVSVAHHVVTYIESSSPTYEEDDDALEMALSCLEMIMARQWFMSKRVYTSKEKYASSRPPGHHIQSIIGTPLIQALESFITDDRFARDWSILRIQRYRLYRRPSHP